LAINYGKDIDVQSRGFVLQTIAHTRIGARLIEIRRDQSVVANIQSIASLQDWNRLKIGRIVVGPSSFFPVCSTSRQKQSCSIDARISCIASLNRLARKSRFFVTDQHGLSERERAERDGSQDQQHNEQNEASPRNFLAYQSILVQSFAVPGSTWLR
jgi:hypothetical protein